MQNDFDIVVVGFGPSGAVATGLLGKLGISTLCIDRTRTVYDKPRAIAVDHEIMRVFQGLGVAEHIAPHVAVFPPSEYYGVDGQLIKRIDTVPKPYPLGYTPTMVFTQPPVEAALRDRAASYDCVEIALGTELVDFSQDAQGVTLRLHDDTGGERTVTSRYLIGCDGASSTVRTQLGIEYDDLNFDEPWLVVDVRVNEKGIKKLPKVAIQYCEPDRPCTYIIGPDSHRRWEIMLLPDEDPRAMQDDGQVWKLLSRWLTPEDGELWRAASYRFHALVAREWRKGRVFIAGDAAHQQPPFIGQGMCQGVRDVVNLIWKLDLVLRSHAPDSLLDTYHIERSAHVKQLTTRIKDIGRLICERDVQAARERDARLLREAGGVVKTIARQDIVPALEAGLLSNVGHAANGTLFPQPRIARGDTEVLFDVAVGEGWRIVTARLAVLSNEALAAAKPLGACLIQLEMDGNDRHAVIDFEVDAVVELDGVLAGWFDKHQCEAAIVRPDHYVFGVARNAVELVQQLEQVARAIQ
ncbi:bifunctional 3-(3-hydroxy-phenyl)propionate/3-hydroxycinnamic acid hydroxylase [Paraburkholderia sp. BL6665CI2N2]|uniref:bifunctional 3-(3-hydroxy-phenyl)propionate/3-hydroxycinnamic acid hydroxylase MhpA n=1 Tax=Paraburkholderia sp. BL6665CI2N2 TaxID=1938806 RepID=UPI001064AC0E|nr:bifunctional 3-(3-hydroxy-phenyl)propionate/3-hydroxycinnamic acid hydroxylase [Paraburkholderia sp. BL6665CI2N2]